MITNDEINNEHMLFIWPPDREEYVPLQLVAAAPDLLRAAQDILNWYEEPIDDSELLVALRTAVEKATGGGH